MAWAYPGSRAYFLLSRCVSRCATVSPCIAVVTDIWRTESGPSQRFTETLAPGFRYPAVPVESAPGPADRWCSTVWPTHGPRHLAGSRENPAEKGIAPDWVGTMLSGAVALHIRYRAGQQ